MIEIEIIVFFFCFLEEERHDRREIETDKNETFIRIKYFGKILYR